MINLFRIERTKRSRSRKLPFLPRFGIVFEIADRKISYRQAPILETIVNLLERGPSVSNFNKIVMEQLYEISLPSLARKKTVNIKATTLERKQKKLMGYR